MSKREKYITDAFEAFENLNKALYNIPMDAVRFGIIESIMQLLQKQLLELKKNITESKDRRKPMYLINILADQIKHLRNEAARLLAEAKELEDAWRDWDIDHLVKTGILTKRQGDKLSKEIEPQ